MKVKTKSGPTFFALLMLVAMLCVTVTSSRVFAQSNAGQKSTVTEKDVRYVCPMHPEVTSSSSELCPKCEMRLVRKAGSSESSASEAKAAPVAPTEPIKTTAGSKTESAASYFPNLTMITQDNKPLRFYDDLLKGKTVLINFMFTTCQGICSPMTANLARVQKSLGERVGQNIVMISISVDPTTDTPAILKKFADNFKAQPGWYFLTGEKKNVDWVLYKLGGYVEDKQRHTSVLIIGNVATGEWMKVPAMSNPEEIAKTAIQLAEKNE